MRPGTDALDVAVQASLKLDGSSLDAVVARKKETKMVAPA